MSVAEEIRKLSDLHKEGLLSEAEFAAEKARLLGGGVVERAAPAKVEVAQEVVFLDEDGVFVSSHRIKIREHTFATQNVGSVALEMNWEERKKHDELQKSKASEEKFSGGCLLAILGPLSLWGAIEWNSTFMLATSVFSFLFGAFVYFRRRQPAPFQDEYYVTIYGGGQATKALTRWDRDEVAKIVDACNKAITHRI